MMRIAALASLLLSGIAVAQDVQSKPFNLVIESKNKTLNGQKFAACHSGAAIESLCLAGKTGSNFFLNTTEGAESSLSGFEPSGVLVWNLPIGTGAESESMNFYVDPSTNVALPLFEPSYDAQYVAFDTSSELAIISYLDDTTSPPSGDEAKALKNWYVCQSYYSGYQYQTLNWVLGDASAKPQNPTCVKVQVKRKYV